VGILTRHDLVRAFARSDSEIAAEIRDEAFRGLSWTEDIAFEVDKGEVTLRGKVDTRFDAELLPDLVRSIPGVVGVDSELTGWDPDRNEEVAVEVRRD
jgi:osmotically-inducible protein OsmY